MEKYSSQTTARLQVESKAYGDIIMICLLNVKQSNDKWIILGETAKKLDYWNLFSIQETPNTRNTKYFKSRKF